MARPETLDIPDRKLAGRPRAGDIANASGYAANSDPRIYGAQGWKMNIAGVDIPDKSEGHARSNELKDEYARC